ncbi:uncharacterized protein LOC128269861 [Anopheles cruzii]|uniref:uncharacterized protein LOC128269861 n=1 Tax=Anopheles cruzii TaxID=68878 RepID=UPI0022EC9299|nr:uncharacterized protein LOC128269861 [Anopheles cruzii]
MVPGVWCAVVWWCVWFGRARSETIHFTNSPHSLGTSRNFTTYEIAVPGSKPITIIEANDPPASADRRADPVRPNPSPTTNFRTSTGIRVSRPAAASGDSELGAAGTRKTLYSPELLNKFLKEYSEKLQNADSVTRQRLNEISMITSSSGDPTRAHDDHRVEEDWPPMAADNKVPDDGAKQQDELIFDETHERNVMAMGGGGGGLNKRWYQEPASGGGYTAHHHQQQHKNHPWNVKDGWVTLEAVPWSESKVSKWHAASPDGSKKRPAKGPQPLAQYWDDSEEATPDKYRPIAAIYPSSSYYHQPDASSTDTEEFGYGAGAGPNRGSNPTAPPPTDSLYNRRRPASTLYSERPEGDRIRPATDRWYDQQGPQVDPYDSGPTAGHRDRDIITDGRPPNFPKYATEQQQHSMPVQSAYGSAPADPHKVRPGSYPDRGNGEWVLISTTKGYQYPKRRHGQRAITFSPPATATSHQSVKLTVLPMKNAVDMTTSHNGLIEVSSSTQTVEEAVQQQSQSAKRKPVADAATKPHRKRNPTTTAGFSVMHRRDAAQDSTAVLAAVGAGMVPATMAILAPMVLGRKRKK